MKTSIVALIVLLVGLSSDVFSQEDSLVVDSTSAIYRDYSYIIAPDYDLHNSSVNTRTKGKALHDVFTRGIGPKIKNERIRNISEGVWSFGTTFYTMLMGHEFGHMLRARQAGGRFTMEKFSFPVIYGKMDLPIDHTLEENILAVAGGFEVNYLMVRDIQMDLYRHHKLYNDELSLAFTNRLMYPVYFTIIAPVDPEEPETWIKTKGDPVHWIKPIWERSGNHIFESDGSVNPALSRFYKQAALSTVLWNLIDLNFYNELGASFGGKLLEGKEAKYLIGDRNNGWGYGTFFNTSVVGAELNLVNYFRYNKKLYTLQARYGFPFENIGFGIGAYDLLNHAKRFNFDVVVDVWKQEFYDVGFALSSNLRYNIGNHFQVLCQLGYKTDGYLIGRRMDSGFIGSVGLGYVW